jgi:hypothetical protein
MAQESFKQASDRISQMLLENLKKVSVEESKAPDRKEVLAKELAKKQK